LQTCEVIKVKVSKPIDWNKSFPVKDGFSDVSTCQQPCQQELEEQPGIPSKYGHFTPYQSLLPVKIPQPLQEDRKVEVTGPPSPRLSPLSVVHNILVVKENGETTSFTLRASKNNTVFTAMQDHHAKVENHHNQTQIIVLISDDGSIDVSTSKKALRPMNKGELPAIHCKFKQIADYLSPTNKDFPQYQSTDYIAKVACENGEKSTSPSDPVSFTAYAKQYGLLPTPRWKGRPPRWKDSKRVFHHAPRTIRIVKQPRLHLF